MIATLTGGSVPFLPPASGFSPDPYDSMPGVSVSSGGGLGNVETLVRCNVVEDDGLEPASKRDKVGINYMNTMVTSEEGMVASVLTIPTRTCGGGFMCSG